MQLDDYILTKSLGKGSFGEVFLTSKKNSNILYATKRLDRAFSEKPQIMKNLTKEISILKAIRHPNIIKLIELKKTKNHIYLITEFCNGGSLSACLMKYINTHYKPFTEKIVQYIMKQIVNALCFLHSKKIIHRDLKLDNILVNFPSEQDKNALNMMSVTVKLIDFGFATVLQSSKANLTYTVLGTPENMEPHLIKNIETKTHNQQGYDEKADIWSLGTLCYEMLVGHMAFGGGNIKNLYRNLEKGDYTLPINSSKEAVSFINGMLQNDPNKRLSASELLNHSFLTKNVADFQPIDTSKIQNKISGNVMKVNFKDNKTIWGIFNQDNEVQFVNNKNANIINNQITIPQQNKRIIKKNYSGKQLLPQQNLLNYGNLTGVKATPQKNNFYNYQVPKNPNIKKQLFPNPKLNQDNVIRQYMTNPQSNYVKGVEGFEINKGEKKNNNQIPVEYYYQSGNYNF